MEGSAGAFILPNKTDLIGTVRSRTDEHDEQPNAAGFYETYTDLIIEIDVPDGEEVEGPTIDITGLRGSPYKVGDRVVVSISKHQP